MVLFSGGFRQLWRAIERRGKQKHMNDDTQRVSTADLKLILRNTEKGSRDAEAALEATERLVTGVGARFDALEGRVTALERRITGLERGMDGIARSNHRIENMLADILVRLSAT